MRAGAVAGASASVGASSCAGVGVDAGASSPCGASAFADAGVGPDAHVDPGSGAGSCAGSGAAGGDGPAPSLAALFPDVHIVPSARLLGAVVGDLQDPAFALPFVRQRTAAALSCLPALEFMCDRDGAPDWFAQWHVLRACSAARAGWLPRVMPCSSLGSYAADVDSLHRRHAARIILGSPDRAFSAEADWQLHLPTAQGGFGLPSVSRSLPAAALASWSVTFSMLRPHLSTSPLLGATLATPAAIRAALPRAGRSLGLVRAYDRARADFDSHRLTGRRAPFALPTSLPLVVAAAKTVASRDIMANSHSRALWALRASPALLVADHDRLDSASATTALGHQFLHLPPRAVDVGAPPLHFPSPLFRTSLQLRLGTPLSPLRGATFCRCGGRLDVHGHHSLSCVTGGATFRRHEALVHGLTSLASAAGFSATTTGLQHF